MGLYDEIRWDAALPEDHSPDDRIFQTKSLDRCLEHFLVSPEGRLLLLPGSGWEDDDLEHAQDLHGVDVEFHGDMRLISMKAHRDYLARFTHGVLEWIKPLDEGEAYDPVALARRKLAGPQTAATGTPECDAPEAGS